MYTFVDEIQEGQVWHCHAPATEIMQMKKTKKLFQLKKKTCCIHSIFWRFQPHWCDVVNGEDFQPTRFWYDWDAALTTCVLRHWLARWRGSYDESCRADSCWTMRRAMDWCRRASLICVFSVRKCGELMAWEEVKMRPGLLVYGRQSRGVLLCRLTVLLDCTMNKSVRWFITWICRCFVAIEIKMKLREKKYTKHFFF